MDCNVDCVCACLLGSTASLASQSGTQTLSMPEFLSSSDSLAEGCVRLLAVTLAVTLAVISIERDLSSTNHSIQSANSMCRLSSAIVKFVRACMRAFVRA